MNFFLPNDDQTRIRFEVSLDRSKLDIYAKMQFALYANGKIMKKYFFLCPLMRIS